jgi:hypothetical protein
MQALYSFANHVGGLSAQTVETRAHRFHSRVIGESSRRVSADPSKFLLRYPSLLSARRGDPHSAFSASVNNRKAPLRIQIQYVSIGNKLRIDRINNLNLVRSQDEFRFNPENVNQDAKKYANNQISNDLQVVLNYPETVNGEKYNQKVRSACPSKVAAGPKGLIHHPSIAGERK